MCYYYSRNKYNDLLYSKLYGLEGRQDIFRGVYKFGISGFRDLRFGDPGILFPKFGMSGFFFLNSGPRDFMFLSPGFWDQNRLPPSFSRGGTINVGLDLKNVASCYTILMVCIYFFSNI